MDEQRLNNIGLFDGLARRERRRVAQLADEVEVESGKRLMDEGTLAYEFFVIQTGTAEVLQNGVNVRELGPGDFFGEIALVGDGVRTASVVATSPMRLIVLTRKDFRTIEREMGAVADQIRAALDERRAADAAR